MGHPFNTKNTVYFRNINIICISILSCDHKDVYTMIMCSMYLYTEITNSDIFYVCKKIPSLLQP